MGDKIWIFPAGCAEPLCPSIPTGPTDPACKESCLGCFYASPILGADGTTLTVGLGYGNNKDPVAHDGVNGIELDFTSKVTGGSGKSRAQPALALAMSAKLCRWQMEQE